MRPVMTMKPVYKDGYRSGYEENGEATFLQWGVEYEEFENGTGNYSVAIVERPDGRVETIVPYCIRFLDSEEAKAGDLDEAIRNPIIV